MAIKSILYRIDTGLVITYKDISHQWSDIERGVTSINGVTFAVVDMDLTDDQMNYPDDANDIHNPCIACKELKVNDVDNPTSLVGV